MVSVPGIVVNMGLKLSAFVDERMTESHKQTWATGTTEKDPLGNMLLSGS